MFLSQMVEDEDKYLSEEFLAGEDIDYGNSTDIVAEDDPYEDIEDDVESEDSPDLDVYPNGTVVKFKCSQTRGGKFASWQIRSAVM